MYTIHPKMLIFIKMIWSMLRMKFNTPFFLRDKVKEFGKSFTKLLTALMSCCMYSMLEIQMEPELSSLSIIWKTNVQISILFLFSINVILFLLRLLKNGLNISQKLLLHLLSQLQLLIHSVKVLLFNCLNNLIFYIRIEKIFQSVSLAILT